MCPLPGSLASNQLCGINPYTGQGTYTAEGIIKLCDALKVNETLKELEYAAPSPS